MKPYCKRKMSKSPQTSNRIRDKLVLISWGTTWIWPSNLMTWQYVRSPKIKMNGLIVESLKNGC